MGTFGPVGPVMKVIVDRLLPLEPLVDRDIVGEIERTCRSSVAGSICGSMAM